DGVRPVWEVREIVVMAAGRGVGGNQCVLVHRTPPLVLPLLQRDRRPAQIGLSGARTIPAPRPSGASSRKYVAIVAAGPNRQRPCSCLRTMAKFGPPRS